MHSVYLRRVKYLIAGLGNIGGAYHDTRHNIGFDILDHLAIKYDVKFVTERLGDITRVKYKGRILVLLKPSTYMNLSGKAVSYWMQAEKIPKENILVICDDLAFDLHTIRLKGNGSDGGHNGLKNIQETLGSTDYSRIRFGIGNDFPKGKQVEFVLGKWKENEIPLVLQKIDTCIQMIESFVTMGLQRTMNQYNHKKETLPGDKT